MDSTLGNDGRARRRRRHRHQGPSPSVRYLAEVREARRSFRHARHRWRRRQSLARDVSGVLSRHAREVEDDRVDPGQTWQVGPEKVEGCCSFQAIWSVPNLLRCPRQASMNT